MRSVKQHTLMTRLISIVGAVSAGVLLGLPSLAMVGSQPSLANNDSLIAQGGGGNGGNGGNGGAGGSGNNGGSGSRGGSSGGGSTGSPSGTTPGSSNEGGVERSLPIPPDQDGTTSDDGGDDRGTETNQTAPRSGTGDYNPAPNTTPQRTTPGTGGYNPAPNRGGAGTESYNTPTGPNTSVRGLW